MPLCRPSRRISAALASTSWAGHRIEPLKHSNGNTQVASVQSLYALANGGWAGNGLGRGDPTAVPESHTDFMFVSIGSELGLFATLALLVCYALLGWAGYRVAQRNRDGFQQLLAIGLTTAIMVQTLLITAGTTNLIPLTGITLPFVSYGGSATLVNFAMLGILLRISAVRKPASVA